MSQMEEPRSDKVEFSEEQQNVLDAVLAGKSIFITGAAGVGKSFILGEVIKVLPPSSTYVTASTGVAACNISGITFHSFAGIGLGNAPYEELLNRAARKFNLEKWLKCRALIIDEISMIDGELFEKVEHIARTLRGDERPFGGIQLVLCGDFLQLPPVQRDRVKMFCFEVPAWKRCVQMTMVLRRVFRQRDDNFIAILSRVRLGEMTLKDRADLLKCHYTKKIFDDKIHATKLFPHRISCEQVNNKELDALPGEAKVYKCIDGGKPQFLEQMDKYSRFLKVVSLKVGAQVMLLKNLSVTSRLVNGSRGVVMRFASEKQLALEKVQEDTPGFKEIYDQLVKSSQFSDEEFPFVKFTNGIEKLIQFSISSIEVAGHEVAYRKQVPLALAWAVSVHKAQGMTLERVELSLSNVFECGQAYVALSRCTSLEGLRLDDFSQDKVRAHPTVLAFYKDLEDKFEEKAIEQCSNRADDSVTEGCLDSVERNETIHTGGTTPGLYQRWNNNVQASMRFPGLSGVATVGNKLFKSSSTISWPSRTEAKVNKRRRSMKSRNGLFASNVKQAKIDVELYSTEKNKSIDSISNSIPTIGPNLKNDPDLVVID